MISEELQKKLTETMDPRVRSHLIDPAFIATLRQLRVLYPLGESAKEEFIKRLHVEHLDGLLAFLGLHHPEVVTVQHSYDGTFTRFTGLLSWDGTLYPPVWPAYRFMCQKLADADSRLQKRLATEWLKDSSVDCLAAALLKVRMVQLTLQHMAKVESLFAPPPLPIEGEYAI